MMHRHATVYPFERLEALKKARREILNSALRHGATWLRQDQNREALWSQLLSDIACPHEKQKRFRRALVGSRLQPVSALRAPSAMSKQQRRKGAREVRRLEHGADAEDRLLHQSATTYRALSARCNYLSTDRPDIQFPVKECCSEMSKPTKRSWKRLERIAGYLRRRPRPI